MFLFILMLIIVFVFVLLGLVRDIINFSNFNFSFNSPKPGQRRVYTASLCYNCHVQACMNYVRNTMKLNTLDAILNNRFAEVEKKRGWGLGVVSCVCFDQCIDQSKYFYEHESIKKSFTACFLILKHTQQ